MFASFHNLRISQQVKADCESALSKNLKLQKLARRPLLLQSHKPIPIATYAPKFSSNSSSYIHAYDPDRERAAANKLRREYKQERKGALRELRKDARFLAREKQDRQAERDAAYNLSMKRALGSIEVERAEEKKMIKEKMRERKRAGRK
jgi:nucleolar protein 14